jgi:hypothetical protein
MLSISNIKSLAIIFILLMILSVIILLATTSQQSPTPSPLPVSSITPTSFPNLAPPSISPAASINTTYNEYSPQYLEEQERISQEEQPVINQALTVSAFIDKLPFKGQFISVTYNIYNNQVYLEYNRADKNQALQEFANLLKENKIENINWLYNLSIIEK